MKYQYLPTPQDYLEKSALLLQAYPDTTRITTKYHFPQPQKKNQKSSSTTTTTSQPPADAQTPAAPAEPSAPIASLTLKTFDPTSGICLKYRTNKAAEVGRLITSLGKLAGGADVASLGLGPAVAAPGGDVEMTEATEEGASTPVPAAAATPTTTGTSGKGGKGKKKGGKGKR